MLTHCLFWFIEMQVIIQKGIKPKGLIYQKVLSNVTINGQDFYDQPIDSDIKRYAEITKLTAGQNDDYTTGCLLD